MSEIGNKPTAKAAHIITVGFNPVWDRTCYVNGIEWGDHKVVDSQTHVPAGKALNISKALAWMSVPSFAAGLWGAEDYPQMLEALSDYQELIQPVFTVAEGSSRQNITVVDTRQNREFHLRSAETLITSQSLGRLKEDLREQLNPKKAVVFAGSVTDGPLQKDCIALIQDAGDQCDELIVDTSGAALSKIVDKGGIDLIKPNFSELCELLGRTINNEPRTIISEARQLCDRVKVVIVSLGKSGALVVTQQTACYCRIETSGRPAVHTVGCGDYLLAGYLASSQTVDIAERLAAGVKAATARAWGWVGAKSWDAVQNEIAVEMRRY